MDRPSWLACRRGSCITGGSSPLPLAEGARERLLWWLAEAGGVLRVTALRVTVLRVTVLIVTVLKSCSFESYSFESYSFESYMVLRVTV